jgi:hypothetical protein
MMLLAPVDGGNVIGGGTPIPVIYGTMVPLVKRFIP